MKKIFGALCGLGLMVSLAGCGGEAAAPPSEAEKAKLNEGMKKDMENMTKGLPKTPGAGQPAPKAP